jgi:hypothetical protein
MNEAHESRPSKGEQGGTSLAPTQELIDAWFDTVLAGEADEPHPSSATA